MARKPDVKNLWRWKKFWVKKKSSQDLQRDMDRAASSSLPANFCLYEFRHGFVNCPNNLMIWKKSALPLHRKISSHLPSGFHGTLPALVETLWWTAPPLTSNILALELSCVEFARAQVASWVWVCVNILCEASRSKAFYRVAAELCEAAQQMVVYLGYTVPQPWCT